MDTKNMENTNPLQKYYRQPAIYIKLPSGGKYYSKEVFTPTETGEIPILPMTAKDELTFKTPDSMINGQATVDVIKSCVPNLLDPWKMVNYDTDAVLLAIRIATFGETMDVSYLIPSPQEERQTSTVNLPALLEELGKVTLEDYATTSKGFKVKIQPLDYKTLTKVQIAKFEQQKMYGTINSSTLTEDQKQTAFSKSFETLNTVNFSLLLDSIQEITTPDGVVVTDRQQIIDFVNNADTVTVREIEEKLTALRLQAQMKPIKVKATEEQIKKGVPATFEVPITFDNSNFFG
tara:strand:- start:213 stop:1085 length:873 start_codon:yes stop_codon:yes gene_type:complete